MGKYIATILGKSELGVKTVTWISKSDKPVNLLFTSTPAYDSYPFL